MEHEKERKNAELLQKLEIEQENYERRVVMMANSNKMNHLESEENAVRQNNTL